MVAVVILRHFLEQGFEGLQLLIQIGPRGLGHLGGVERGARRSSRRWGVATDMARKGQITQ
jgi:hypothetical protein